MNIEILKQKDNYLEAVGVIQAMKEGIEIQNFFRPIEPTKIINEG